MISILIIEDDTGICELLIEQLTERNYLSVCKHTGKDALEWLESNSPSIIVLDYGLPDMNGKAFITKLRQRSIPIPPFIIATGQGDESIAVEMMKLGAKDYIIKDTAFLELLPEVIKHIEKEINNENKLKMAEEQLYQSRKMEAIGKLAGGIAHDFNNMLTGIMGASYVLQKKMENDNESQEFIKIIIESSTRAADLTAKLLAFGRKGKTNSTPVDIHQIINDTTSLLERSINKTITINNQLTAIQHTIIGDYTLLQNAFLNIGINASHAMPSGGTLTFSTNNIFIDEKEAKSSHFPIQSGEYLQIDIQDTGTGIAEENLQKIFEPFYTTKKQGEGTGLGLSAVYGTVQEHHGTIKVDSIINSGTTFTIQLPIAHEDIQSEEVNEQITPGTGTILFTDDEKSIRITVKTMLEDMGYSVLTAETGLEALEIFEKNHQHIHAVILDMNMPTMGGKEAFFKIKEIDNNANIIISTGYCPKDDLQELIDAGLSGHIWKPYNPSELNKLLIELLPQ